MKSNDNINDPVKATVVEATVIHYEGSESLTVQRTKFMAKDLGIPEKLLLSFTRNPGFNLIVNNYYALSQENPKFSSLPREKKLAKGYRIAPQSRSYSYIFREGGFSFYEQLTLIEKIRETEHWLEHFNYLERMDAFEVGAKARSPYLAELAKALVQAYYDLVGVMPSGPQWNKVLRYGDTRSIEEAAKYPEWLEEQTKKLAGLGGGNFKLAIKGGIDYQEKLDKALTDRLRYSKMASEELEETKSILSHEISAALATVKEESYRREAKCKLNNITVEEALTGSNWRQSLEVFNSLEAAGYSVAEIVSAVVEGVAENPHKSIELGEGWNTELLNLGHLKTIINASRRVEGRKFSVVKKFAGYVSNKVSKVLAAAKASSVGGFKGVKALVGLGQEQELLLA